jgi:large subunit ribosomal protein L6
MSRKGKMPVVLPKGVEVQVKENVIHVKGPKGTLTETLVPGVSLKIEKDAVSVEVSGTSRQERSFHGLYRALVQNMVTGTATGFEKKLEMQGVGYRAAVQGKNVDLQLGFSHPTPLPIPEGIQVKIEKNTLITISGANKQMVGQFAAEIRAVKPPEPYQGKGVRYDGEYVRRKAGKAAKSAKK